MSHLRRFLSAYFDASALVLTACLGARDVTGYHPNWKRPRQTPPSLPRRPHSRAALTPAPPELIAKAEALLREYDVQCFWFWHPDAKVRTLEDLGLVIKELRRNGNHKAWLAAQELRRCL